MSFTDAKIVSSGVNPNDYHQQEAQRGSAAFLMSPSALGAFMQCPARWIAGYQSPESKSKRWGSLMDTLLTLPDG